MSSRNGDGQLSISISFSFSGTFSRATSAGEELVRGLGLRDDQASRLQWPDRLPDLPKAPRQTAITAATTQQRLDVQLAHLQPDIAGRSQGLTLRRV